MLQAAYLAHVVASSCFNLVLLLTVLREEGEGRQVKAKTVGDSEAMHNMKSGLLAGLKST